MARGKGMGCLQKEKSGRWTMRVCINGKRYSKSTRTMDRDKAERFLQRFLAPFGRGERRIPLCEAWIEYVKSPNRNDNAISTLNTKRLVWHHFAEWMEKHHLEINNLAAVTSEAIAEYLACLRLDVCASTYNGRVCVLREIFHVLAEKGGVEEDPWAFVKMRADDSHSRRELTFDELRRLLDAAKEKDINDKTTEWYTLFAIGIYTGLRLGDCCCLKWQDINLERGIIQVIPRKTRRHAHGRPVTIPIHPELNSVLQTLNLKGGEYVLSNMAENYLNGKWRVSKNLGRIFKRANITMSVKVEGRRHKTPEATFHSLRHTFVSLAANAGVPLPIVQSIVGHCSTAMTRHYYHDNENDLRRAVAAIPIIGKEEVAHRVSVHNVKGTGLGDCPNQQPSPARRLQRLKSLLDKALISEEEYSLYRVRILSEL